jgi:hypothetical protein
MTDVELAKVVRDALEGTEFPDGRGNFPPLNLGELMSTQGGGFEFSVNEEGQTKIFLVQILELEV